MVPARPAQLVSKLLGHTIVKVNDAKESFVCETTYYYGPVYIRLVVVEPKHLA